MQMAILDKIERNCKQFGLTASRAGDTVVVENGANDLTISLVAADIMKPMGGVDPTVSPFLGAGVANPCTIKLKSVTATPESAGPPPTSPNIGDILDSSVAATVLKILGGFANDLLLENGDASYTLKMRGHGDLIGVGQ